MQLTEIKPTTLLTILLIAPIVFGLLSIAIPVLSVAEVLRWLCIGTGIVLTPVVGLGAIVSGIAAHLRGKYQEDHPPLLFLLAFLALFYPIGIFGLYVAGGR